MPATTSRYFSLADSQAFGRFSGDTNPIHVDPVAARRTLFGHTVVHGIHTVLWALEAARIAGTLARIEVKFVGHIPHDRLVECREERRDGNTFSLALVKDGAATTRIKGTLASGVQASVPESTASSLQPAVLELGQMRNLAGAVPLACEPRQMAELFPELGLPIWQVAVFLATTRVVGMEVPGLHSLYSSLMLQFGAPSGAPQLQYHVSAADERFSLVELVPSGFGVSGLVRAFVRPSPQPQAGLEEAARLVQPKEFGGWRVLIAGGSRGLGETAAKLIAAGGGAVFASYHRGSADAEALCTELRAAGREAHAGKLDVIGGAVPKLPWAPTHLLYFATPHIVLDKNTPFSAERFEQFCAYYVTGFQKLFAALPGLAGVLYPSTIFLDETAPQTAEYCAAKAAGEELCRHLAKRHPGVRFHAPRLPRVRTDQTVGLLPTDARESMPVVLAALRTLATS